MDLTRRTAFHGYPNTRTTVLSDQVKAQNLHNQTPNPADL
jgi:hypothetical protein